MPSTIAKYLGDTRKVDFGVHAELADAIFSKAEFASSSTVGDALSNYLSYKLDEVNESLDFVADWLSDIQSDGPWSRDDVLTLVQIEDEHLAAFSTRLEVQSVRVPVTRARLVEWRASAEALASELDQISVFGSFADLEDEFEPIAHIVAKAVTAVDHEIQQQIDIARGK